MQANLCSPFCEYEALKLQFHRPYVLLPRGSGSASNIGRLAGPLNRAAVILALLGMSNLFR